MSTYNSSEKDKQAARDYVENNSDSEVRRMYGHHLRTFLAGVEYKSRENAKMLEAEKLDLNQLRELSVLRAKYGFKTYDNVSILFFTTALAGELGELCNMIKKLERVKAGGLDAGTNEKAKDISKNKLMEEIGGILIYLDLLASLLDINLSEAVIKTFNDKSLEYNLGYFLLTPAR